MRHQKTPGDPTIVIAGYPNVGKSSLLARLSKARPEIAPYPFTTKSANIGHFQWPEAGPAHRQKRYQAVDTPGLLEKPAAKRNYIEQQAVLALKYLADAVVFVLDPSEACGYDLPTQEKLLAHVRQEFPTAPLMVVENKADLVARPDSPNLRISCQKRRGHLGAEEAPRRAGSGRQVSGYVLRRARALVDDVAAVCDDQDPVVRNLGLPVHLEEGGPEARDSFPGD